MRRLDGALKGLAHSLESGAAASDVVAVRLLSESAQDDERHNNHHKKGTEGENNFHYGEAVMVGREGGWLS